MELVQIRRQQGKRDYIAEKLRNKVAPDAWRYTGGLSAPAKMPGFGYGIPASECKVGSRLRKVAGSTCADCYACKGNYLYDNVAASQGQRFSALSDLPAWTHAMIGLIGEAVALGAEPYFRWHDAGALQIVEHLAAIADIARALPNVAFWLPTREYDIVAKFVRRSLIPANLTIRLSAHMIDGQAPSVGLPVSYVHDKSPAQGKECPAPSQGGYCGSCRACWSNDVKAVSYRKH